MQGLEHLFWLFRCHEDLTWSLLCFGLEHGRLRATPDLGDHNVEGQL